MVTKNEKTTAVTAAAQNAVVVPEDLDIFADAGQGSEHVSQNDVMIPRLQVAQSMSPQLKKNKPEYIEGCEEGSIFNTATGEIYDTPLRIVPVYYHRRYVEWVPREKGGGLVNADHSAEILDQCAQADDGGNYLPNGNEIVDTPEHYVIAVRPDGTYEPVVLSMAGTKAKISRRWNTAIRNVKIRNPATGAMVAPARWYQSYALSSVPENNDKGDFMNFKIETSEPTLSIPDVGPEVYRAAKEFYGLINEGRVKSEVEDPHAAKAEAQTDAF